MNTLPNNIRVSVLAILTAFPISGLAANHFVIPGGTGTRDGSDWANAYSSLPTTLVRGDTYYLADGTYSGQTFSTAASGTATITIKKATPSDHGTDTGWNDSYGNSQVAFAGGLSFTTPYWVLDGQTGGGAENNWVGNFGIKITERGDANALISIDNTSANNITLRHIDFQGKGSVSNSGGSYSNDGLAIYGASNVTLSYFHMAGIGRCPFFISPKNLVIEHGWVQSYNGSSAVHSEVASIWAFSTSMGDVTFRYNLFTDIKSTGGIMWDNSSNNSAKLTVHGNIFYKPPGAVWEQANGVIGGWTGGGGEQFRNASVTNNTFINVDQESLSTFPNVYSGNSAYNNLFYNSESPDFAKFGSHDYNTFINSGDTHSEANGTSVASGDPFVDYLNLNFRLKGATAAGLVLNAPLNVDPVGLVRGSDGVFDRGAFEFNAGSPLPSPSPSPTPSASPSPSPTPTPTPSPSPVPTSPYSLFTTQIPTSLNNSDGSKKNYELGMKFMSTTAGKITGIRFYKSPSESGNHTGKIYSESGALLVSGTFSSETSSGWQTLKLATPLSINANTVYVVSVNTGKTYYVATVSGLASQVTQGSLMSVVGNNGVFGPVGSMPTQSWNQSNYFRDVIFAPN
jgi:hypothetical protein